MCVAILADTWPLQSVGSTGKHRPASEPGPLYAFPWEGLGNSKYVVVLLPFVCWAVRGDDADRWAFHMLALAALRYLHAQAWNTLSRAHAVSARTRITGKPVVEYKQVDRESTWDDYILLQVLVMTAVHCTPGLGFSGFPTVCWRGLAQLLLLHAGPTELLCAWLCARWEMHQSCVRLTQAPPLTDYGLHRLLHWHPLYKRYHSHHHASFVAEPITGELLYFFSWNSAF